MTISISKLLVNVSVKLYSLLLLAYPMYFRWEYGEEMRQLFRDMMGDAIRQKGFWGVVEVWFCVLPDLVVTARQQRLLSGNYYRSKRLAIGIVQAIISAILMVWGFVYWWQAR